MSNSDVSRQKPSYSYRTAFGTFRITPAGSGYALSIHFDSGIGQELRRYADAQSACSDVFARTSGFDAWDRLPKSPPMVENLSGWLRRPIAD